MDSFSAFADISIPEVTQDLALKLDETGYLEIACISDSTEDVILRFGPQIRPARIMFSPRLKK